MEKQESLYQKMEAAWKEREGIFEEREQALKRHREELKGFETACMKRKQELEAAKQEASQELQRVMQEKTSLQYLHNERLRLDGEWEALERERTKAGLGIAGTIRRPFTEPAPCDTQGEPKPGPNTAKGEKPKPEPDIAKEANPGPRTVEGLNIAESTVPEPNAPEEPERTEPERTEPERTEPERTGPERKEPEETGAEETAPEEGEDPETLQRFAAEARRAFPEGKEPELTKGMFTMPLGDKKLQIASGSPMSIAILAEREWSKYLMKGIEQFNIIQNEWEFSYQDGYLRCAMPFTEATPPEAVMQKCAEALQRFFK